MMTLNGGKIYGPKQSGVLYVSSKVMLQPILRGGGQERNLRSGTENVAACAGFAKALELTQARRHAEIDRLGKLQTVAYRLITEKLPSAVINGSQKHRLPNNIHITLPGQDNERLLVQLDERGILAAAGSACSASDDEPSHVLRAMGISDADARASLRLTMGRATTESDLQTLVNTLAELL
jgi:cysteine desulfurase